MKASEYRLLDVKEHWAKVGDEALAAAQNSAGNKHWRSAVNRSYYAAYSFAASVLAKQGIDFRDDRVGPEHEPLPNLVVNHLDNHFTYRTLDKIRQSLTTLYKLRVNADYYPHLTTDKSTALSAVTTASALRKLLEGELP